MWSRALLRSWEIQPARGRPRFRLPFTKVVGDEMGGTPPVDPTESEPIPLDQMRDLLLPITERIALYLETEPDR